MGRSRSGIAVFRRLQTQVIRRLGWGVADQAMSSISNFAVNIYIARTLGAVQYGAFALAYVTYSFALNASRGLATDPLLVRFSGTDVRTWRRAVAGCTGTAATVGLVTGACVLVAAALLGGTARSAFLALGLTLPGLLLQDSWRYAFFALGRGSQAFLNDAVWVVVLLPVLVLLRVTGHADVFWFVLAWGASGAAAAAVGPLQARVMPRLLAAKSWVSRHRDLGPRYLAEGTANSASTQLRNYGIDIILGLAAVGYVQAGNTLMGPFTVVFFGMGLVTLPEAARLWRDSPRKMPLFCLLYGGGLALLAIAWGVALLVILPRGFGHWLLGSIWRPTYPLVLPLTIGMMGGCLGAGAGTGLHALGAARRSLRAMIISSVLMVAGALLGAVAGGAVGTVRGLAVATWMGTLAYWWELRSGLRESGSPLADGWLSLSRSAGRHRRFSASALAPSLDATVPLDLTMLEAALHTDAPRAAAMTESSSPSLAALNTGQRPVDPARRVKKPTVTAKVALATSATVVLAIAAAAAGWMLTHEPRGTGVTVGVPTHAAAPQGMAKRVSVAPSGRAPAAVPVRELMPVRAIAFNPYGDGQDDDNALASLAIDASPTTAWHTHWYTTAQFGGLQPGTGLILDMGRRVTITSVRLLLGSADGADLQLRVGNAASSLADLPPVAHRTDVGGQVLLRPTRPVRGRYVLIWFTKLPPDTSGTFQASVYNVQLRGWT